jgi:hypothetical protein
MNSISTNAVQTAALALIELADDADTVAANTILAMVNGPTSPSAPSDWSTVDALPRSDSDIQAGLTVVLADDSTALLESQFVAGDEQQQQDEETDNQQWSLVKISAVLPKCAFGYMSGTNEQVFFPASAFAFREEGGRLSFIDIKHDCPSLVKGVIVQALVSDKAPDGWKTTEKNSKISRWTIPNGCDLQFCQVTQSDPATNSFQACGSEDAQQVIQSVDARIISCGNAFALASLPDKGGIVYIPQQHTNGLQKGATIKARVIPFKHTNPKSGKTTDFVLVNLDSVSAPVKQSRSKNTTRPPRTTRALSGNLSKTNEGAFGNALGI